MSILDEIRAYKLEDVARRESADSGSALDGGSLGRGTLEQLTFVEPFEQAAAALAAGEISQPVQTQFGWHVIEVDDVRPTDVDTPAALRAVASTLASRT